MLKLVKNIIFVSTGGILDNVVAFFFMVYVARQLGVEEFGRYALVGTIVLMVQHTINIGLHPVAVRTLAAEREKEKEHFQDIVSLKLAIGGAAYLVLLLLSKLLSYDSIVSNLILIHGVGLITSSVTMSYEIYFIARQEQKIPVFFAAVNSLVTACVGVLVLENGGSLFQLFVATLFWTVLFMILWSFFFFVKTFSFRFCYHPQIWVRMVKEVLPLAPIVAVNRTNRQVNLFMLSKVPGPTPADLAMGLLQPALSITNVPITLFMRLRSVFLSWAANHLGREVSLKNEFTLIIQLVVLLFVSPLILGLTYFHHELIVLIFGKDFVGGGTALALLGWASGFNMLIIVTEGLIFATNRVQKFVKVYILTLAINFALCFLLVPFFGTNGAAIALLATRIVQFLMVFWLCHNWVPEFAFPAKQMSLPIAVVIALFFATESLFLFFTGLWLKVILSSIIWTCVVSTSSYYLIRKIRHN